MTHAPQEIPPQTLTTSGTINDGRGICRNLSHLLAKSREVSQPARRHML